jgi:hypothetical protein
MTTPSVYDTPPNGDFAKYVEALGRAAETRVLQQQSAVHPAAAPQRGSPRQARPAPSAAHAVTPTTRPAAGLSAFAPVRSMLKLGLMLWVGYIVASSVFPPLAVIGWPLLLCFAVVAFVRLRSLPWAGLAQVVRLEAEQKIRRP